MRKRTDKPKSKTSCGDEIVASLGEAVSWAKGEPVPVRITIIDRATVPDEMTGPKTGRIVKTS